MSTIEVSLDDGVTWQTVPTLRVIVTSDRLGDDDGTPMELQFNFTDEGLVTDYTTPTGECIKTGSSMYDELVEVLQ